MLSMIGETMENDMPKNPEEGAGRAAQLPEAAQRALAEAAQRRAAYEAWQAARPKEIGGAKGPEPVRYGDWEIKGIACDF